jgi:hypothetical protein
VQSSIPQSCGVGVEQLPLPLQKAAGVKMVPSVPEQVGPWHIVVPGAFWQAPPLQSPVLPQVPFGGQRPFGSGLPLVTALQVPTPFRLQAWQGLQAVTLQQAPSVQMPFAHSWLPPQVPPGPLSGTQAPIALQ